MSECWPLLFALGIFSNKRRAVMHIPQNDSLLPGCGFQLLFHSCLVSASVLEKLLGPSSCFLFQVPRVLFLGTETNPIQANNTVIGILCRRRRG